jgi:hypothetical protein
MSVAPACKLLLNKQLAERLRGTAEQRDELATPHGGPFSGLGPHVTTPLRKNAAVHHSKNCALMSQMGQTRSSALCPFNVRFARKRTLSALGSAVHRTVEAINNTALRLSYLMTDFGPCVVVPTLGGTNLSPSHCPANCIHNQVFRMHSRVEYYRRRGLAAKERAAQSTDLSVREAFRDVARHWLALAERVDWLDMEHRTGSRLRSQEPTR